ncbi:TlpA disulfide reductase family protein [Chitinophaga sp. sic0106]|uniref:TlpA disulfide reductase family protein n=1 Tax=Chitinophaga sp. sic0106 TaxID=2854785 RepID=UPI001C45AD8A|nr:TlpA disulfide reductase family protein [Chitinophaga sp. sic0106]MBV7529226.1 AhpC/TSA family protein [Chitinophaga sp. sic0106]
MIKNKSIRWAASALLAAANILPAHAQQQPGIIKGTAPAALNGVTIYLIRDDGNLRSSLLDSAVIKNGKFELKDTTHQPFSGMISAVLRKPGQNVLPGYRRIFVKPGDVTVITQPEMKSDKNSMEGAVVTGSAYTKQQDELLAILAPSEKLLDELRKVNRGLTAKDTAAVVANSKRIMAAIGVQDSIKRAYIKAHPEYYVSLFTFSRMIGNRAKDIGQAKADFNTFTPALKKSQLGQQITAVIESSARINVGQPAPGFAAPDKDGKQLSLASFKGKYVLLDFWASWCGPCRHENPTVLKAYNRFKDKNFDILAVSLDRPDGKAAWLKAINDDGLIWHHIAELQGFNGSIPKMYMVNGIPTNYLIDPNGKIIAMNLRGEELEKALEKFVK